MTVCSLDPLVDPRWRDFVVRHADASVFHTPAWLRALQRTYDYEPIVFTTSAPAEELRSALVFANVRSWLSGQRLVSLAFSDHCEPLVENAEELGVLCRFVLDIRSRERWKYVEIRTANSALRLDGDFRRAGTFYLHRLDLRPSVETLLGSFHKVIRQKIRRAQREGLTYEAGRSEALLEKLYGLLRLTRRRHHLPPQPLAWFRNLVDCFGEAACIRIASSGGRPVAGILTLSHGKRVIYKYAGSDARLNTLGGMAWLVWQTIREAKDAGAEELDLGRSDCDNAGLIAFKERWAASRSTLTNWRCPASTPTLIEGWRIQFAKQIFARLPDGMLTAAGKLFYRHIG